ncbi:FG-GAP-like repeat-containing protein, partial [Desulfobacterales bacterium HSG2]|nr:FG-GAP-like repeat-containing protein [Desulfobacterales bacterium HSG2]
VTFGDVNGDGRADLAKHSTVGTVYTYLSDGDGTFGSHFTATGPGGAGSGYVALADVNGDGRADLIKLESDADVFTYLSNGDGTFADYTETGGQGYSIYFADLNGDGRIDLIRGEGSTIHTYLSDGVFGSVYVTTKDMDGDIHFADINGDGRTDIIRHNAKTAYTHFSNGDGTFGSQIATEDVEGDIYFADINGDGRTDLIKNDSGTVRSCLSKGDGTFENAMISNDGPGENIYFADVSGDGLADLIKNDDSDDAVYAFLSDADGPPDLITSISNGIGASTTVEYKPSSYWPNTYLPVGMIMQTIHKMITDDGRGNQSSVEYQYEGGLWSSEERRFLGFRKVTATLDAQGNYTETYYYQKVGSTSKPEITYFKDNQGRIFRYTQYAYTESISPPYTSLLTDRWEYECNLSDNCMKTLHQFTYDEYGNVTATYEWGDYEREEDERTTIRGYFPNTDAYIAGLPAYENVYEGIVNVAENGDITSESGSGELIQRKLFFYDGNTSHETPPTKGAVTEVRRWNDETGGYVSVKNEYDRWGNAIEKTNERGFRSTTTFDTTYHIYPVEKCNSLGLCTELEWDTAMGLLTSSRDVENGAETRNLYDSLGRPLTKTQADGSVIRYEYLDTGDPNAQRVRNIMPDGTADGLWTEVYQDGLGRKYKTVKEGNLIKETVYDSTTTRLWKESLWYEAGEEPRWIVYSYDGAGRLRTAANPDGTSSETVYANDRSGKPYTVTYDELGHEKVVWKDAYGNVTQVREKNGDEYYYTVYEYDMSGNPVRITDSAEGESTSTWDSLGRKLFSCNEDMGCWYYTYNDAGLPTSQKDAKGQTITFTYDELGRIGTKSYPTGEQIQYFYDEAGYGYSKGRLTRVTYPSGSETHTYDIRGVEVSSERCVEGTCQTVSQEYDALGRVTSATYPDGERVESHYDSVGRLREVTGYVDEMLWSAGGQLLSVSFANNTRANFNYNPDRLWMTSATVSAPGGTPLYQAAYNYDDATRVSSITSITNPLLNLNFVYDDLNRLTTVSGSQNQSFEYNSTGNIVFASYENNLMPDMSNADYIYDENGNMKGDGTREFTWNAENRLASIKKGDQTTTFAYNADGDRIRKSSPQGTTKYFGARVKWIDGKLIKYYYAGSILAAKQDDTGKYWYHSDHLGSIRLMTDEQGQKVNQYDYSAFGYTVAESGNAENARNFTGHLRDQETDLIYMGSRYYHPLLGRFVSPDTIVPDPANPQSLNRYAYAYNNPISNIDPTGHAPVAVAVVSAITAISTASAIGGAIGTVITATAVIGAGVSIAGYFAKDPVLSSIGGVMLGFAGGFAASGAQGLMSGLIGATVSGLTSPASPLDSGVKEAIGWAYTIYGNIKSGEIRDVKSGIQFALSEAAKGGVRSLASQIQNKIAFNNGTVGVALTMTSFVGNMLVGSRYAGQKDGIEVMEGINNRGTFGFLFDAADVILGYQGLPTASTYDYMLHADKSRPLWGHSAGTLDLITLKKLGVPQGPVKAFSVPFLNSATPDMEVVIGKYDFVNGFMLGKIFNPDAKIVPSDHHGYAFNHLVEQ